MSPRTGAHSPVRTADPPPSPLLAQSGQPTKSSDAMRPTRSPLVLIVLLLLAGVDDFYVPHTLATSSAEAPCADDDEFLPSAAGCVFRCSARPRRDLPPPPVWQSPPSQGHPPAPTSGTLAGAHASVSPRRQACLK